MDESRAKLHKVTSEYAKTVLEDASESYNSITKEEREEFKKKFDKYKNDITTSTYSHKGYTLSQTNYNYHYMIFDGNGNMVMHVPYKKPITQEMAVEFIEHYISLAEKFDDIYEDLQEDETDI